MEDIISQIRKALSVDLFYLALFVSLTLPDICAAVESEDGETSGAKYRDWYDRYLKPKYPNFTAHDCYFYRCSMLHQGTSEHPKSSYNKILFVEPGQGPGLFHNNVLNDAYNIDVSIFCNDILKAVEQWMRDKSGDEHYDKNMGRLIKRYPNGLPPYIGGTSVIA